MIGTPKLAELIETIQNFDIDGGPVTVSFTQRLAREHRWTLAYAERVVREYKRFVILAMISDTQLTPSETVDEAWHLHLIYTDSYWRRFAAILPKPLHHNPTTGSIPDQTRFPKQFSETVELYKLIFGEKPPRDIWNIRLSQAVARPKKSTNTSAGFTFFIIAFCSVLIAFALYQAVPVLTGVFFMLAVVLVVLGASAPNLASGQQRQSNNNSSTAGCGTASGCGGGDFGQLFDGGDSANDFGGGDSGGSDSGGGDGGGGDGGGGGCGGGCGS